MITTAQYNKVSQMLQAADFQVTAKRGDQILARLPGYGSFWLTFGLVGKWSAYIERGSKATPPRFDDDPVKVTAACLARFMRVSDEDVLIGRPRKCGECGGSGKSGNAMDCADQCDVCGGSGMVRG